MVEAGCGLGKWVIFLSNRGYDISGIDSYPKAVTLLKKYDLKLKVKVDDVANSLLKNSSVDAYLSFGVIEHFEEGPNRPLLEAFRVLKSGGVAIIETPFDNWLRRLRRTWPRNRSKGFFYEYRYTGEELKKFVSEAGFKVLAVYPKDDLSPERSIGLWLDFPFLRDKNRPNFYLNFLGKGIKKIFSHYPWSYSACVVVAAKKI